MLAALLQASVLAGPPTLDSSSLVWRAPAECPGVEQLRDRIDEFAPGMLADAERLGVQIDGGIDAIEGRFEATIRIENQAGVSVRRFAAADCELIGDASALVIAVTLAPLETAAGLSERPQVQRPSEPDHQPAPTDEPPTSEPAAVLDEPSPPTFALSFTPEDDGPSDTSLRVGLRAFGGVSYGPTNTGHGMVGGALALLSERWRVELAGWWSPPRVVRRTELGGVFSGWALAGRGCYVPTVRRLEFPLCPAVELGQVRGRGLDELAIVDEANFLWIALGLGQGLWFAPHERFAVGVDARVAVPLRSGGFVVDDRRIQRLVPVAVSGFAGVEVRLP